MEKSKALKQAKTKSAETVDGYIADFPAPIRERLVKIRAAIRKAAPEAEESISYRIPAYKLNGPLLYFAAFKNHIGIYPITAATKDKFAKELGPYEQSTGTVRFPHEQPLPVSLIEKIAKFKAKENAGRAAVKKKKTSQSQRT